MRCILIVFALVAIAAFTSASGLAIKESREPPNLAEVPNQFQHIDFRNFSYPYTLLSRKRTVSLKNGEYEYDLKDQRGSIYFSDVYFIDLTNDDRPEALVMLSHVACGGSCDGGSALFYVYSFERRKLKLLWQYETGSLAYGCGLKSLSAKKARITLELFGRCDSKQQTSSATGKFLVSDVTRIVFGPKHGRIVARSRTVVSSPTQDVLNYQPQINLPK